MNVVLTVKPFCELHVWYIFWVISGRRTVHNPFKDKSKVWDPYGVSRVDLSDLLLGHRYLYIKVPVHSCPPPDILGLDDNKMGAGKVVGLAGAVDGPSKYGENRTIHP